VELYYARQVYLVGKNIITPIIIATLAIVGYALSIYLAVQIFTATQISNRYTSSNWLAGSLMGVSVVGDALIAGSMCWALYRKKTGFARTDSMIMTLMAYTLQSGLLTCALGAAMTISFIVSPSSMISVAVYLPLSKCYINSVLALLNSRDYIRDRSAPSSDNSIYLSPIRIVPPDEALGSKSTQTAISIVVRRSTASDQAQNQSDHNAGHTFDVPKLL